MLHLDPSKPIRFGNFELDLAACELRHRGQPVSLERRPMNLLILLIEQAGQLVSREQIIQRLWGSGVFLDSETGINTAVRKVRQALGDSPDSPSFIKTVSGRGYRFIAPITTGHGDQSDRSPGPFGARIMLAVLPFVNLSADPDQEYFSDGLTEETISYLGRLNPERLGVVARTTSMAYKRTRKSIQAIGEVLKVDYVLESTVRREHNRVRITAQLVRVKDQTPIWTSTYDRELIGVLAIQSELGTAIAQSVHLQLSTDRLPALANPRVTNADAYDCYLRGRYFWNQLSPPTTKRAIDFYARATQLDPQYAPAWAGLADAYSTSPITGDTPPLQIWPKAREAVVRAIQAAPDLAEVQTSLGFVKFWLDWEWLAAEGAFQKAITLNPSYALAYRLLGIVQMHLCRREESLSAIKRARELDPLNAGHHALSSQVAFAARDFESAIRFAQQAIAIDPEFWIGHFQLGQAYERCGDNEHALTALAEASRLSGGNSKPISLRGYVLARAGRMQEVRELLRTLESVSRERYVPPYAFALIHAGLGDRELTLQFLQRASEVHDVHLAFMTCDPKWDPFRNEPRFADLIAVFH